MVKIGVLGAGHLGKIHLNLIQKIEQLELVGFYDPDDEKANTVSSELGIRRFESIDDLIANVDAVDIVTPTLSHFECAVQCIRSSKHIFIEKPITNTLEEAHQLIKLATEADIKVQVGHVERFNPAFQSAKDYISNPMFIEGHRLAEFNVRGTDVPVVLDLMIHDIDIVLSVVDANVKHISASGVAIVSDTPDIANARIEFDNGCVANLTASRISLKNMRKIRFFQPDAYVGVDFLEKKSEIVKLKPVVGEPDPLAVTLDLGKDKGQKQILFEHPEVTQSNAIMEELICFEKAITQNNIPPVTIHDGANALEIAHQIVDKLRNATNLLEV